MIELSLAVVGADYPNKRGPGRRFEIALCAPGERVDLLLDPKNPADPNAVAVFSCRGVQIGYLTAERCGLIRRLMVGGAPAHAIFQAKTGYGALIRASFTGSPPTLPPPNASGLPFFGADADPEVFYPDPEYPDE